MTIWVDESMEADFEIGEVITIIEVDSTSPLSFEYRNHDYNGDDLLERVTGYIRSSYSIATTIPVSIEGGIVNYAPPEQNFVRITQYDDKRLAGL